MPYNLCGRGQPAAAIVRFCRRFMLVAAIACMQAALLAACASPAPEPSPTPVPTPVSAALPASIAGGADVAVPDMIVAERTASIAGDLHTLGALWAPGARIIDGRGTSESDDDYVWQGHDAVMDRYVLAVLPAPPPPLELAALSDLTINTTADKVVAELGIDTWTLVWLDGRWWFQELQYN